MKSSTSAQKLAERINKAIEDHVLTNAEYEDILRIADEDGVIDPEERALLSQLKEMIVDKTVKRAAE